MMSLTKRNLVRTVLLLIAIHMLAMPAWALQSPVWFWFSTCEGPSMTLDVRFDDELVYRSSFPLCRASSTSANSQGQKARIQFTLVPSRPILWTGYREEDFRSPVEPLTVDLWEAGADPDALLIGVTVRGNEAIYMNTIHIARPEKRAESEIAAGLVIATYPMETPRKTKK